MPRTGSVYVTADVDGAIAYVDGRMIGRVPQRIDSLPPGDHVVEVRTAGRLPVNRVVAVRASELSQVTFQLPLESASAAGSAATTGAGTPHCESQSDCATCTQTSSCGWCGATRRCIAAGANETGACGGGFVSNGAACNATSAVPATPLVAVADTWQSNWGPVTLQHAPLVPGHVVEITGSWQQGVGRIGQITGGTYDPTTRVLRFTYYQPWNNQQGVGMFTVDPGGRSMSGSYTQGNGSGAWTLRR